MPQYLHYNIDVYKDSTTYSINRGKVKPSRLDSFFSASYNSNNAGLWVTS